MGVNLTRFSCIPPLPQNKVSLCGWGRMRTYRLDQAGFVFTLFYLPLPFESWNEYHEPLFLSVTYYFSSTSYTRMKVLP